VCDLAARMCFERVALVQNLADGDTTNLYVWRRTEEEFKSCDVVTMVIPMSGEIVEGVSGIELSIGRQWSLECIGRRVTLFGRLIDEYGLARRQAMAPVSGRTTLTVLSALGLLSRDKAIVRPETPSRAARSSRA